jgi:thiol-disulfide isomerase/thioredoxin
MKDIEIEHELEDAVKDKNRIYILFYASWCPFSQRFLPIYEKHAQKNPQPCLRIKIDDKAKLCEKYSVDVVPTVLVFEKGVVTKRLDGEQGAGLSEQQLMKLLGIS